MSTITALTPGMQATVETAALIARSVSTFGDYATADDRAVVLATVLDAQAEETFDSPDTPALRLPHASAYHGVPSITFREIPLAAVAVAGLRIVPRHVIEQGYSLPYPVETAHYPEAFRAVGVAEVGCRCGCSSTHLLIAESGLRVLGLDWQADEFPHFWPELHNVGCDGGYTIDPHDL